MPYRCAFASRPLTASILLASLVAVGGCDTPPGRPDVLLVTIDTLRADALGVYSDGRNPTPHIDRLAAEGALYERAAAPMPVTRPSHFSILTSRYPREHGVMNNSTALPDSALTLAELLHDSGYRTGAFVSVSLLDADSGALQGFEHAAAPSERREEPAPWAVEHALGWLDTLRADEPFFLWVHLFDPHIPYAPPAEQRRDLGGPLATNYPALGWRKLYTIAEDNDGKLSRDILEHAKALYLREVRYADHWVGELMRGVEERRSPDHLVTVLTADHGECFEDGVYFEHSDCLLEGATRVPLILRHPGSVAAGTRSSAQVSLIDVAPSVLRALGLAIPDGFSGRALQDEAPSPERVVLVQSPFYSTRATDVRLPAHAAIVSVAGVPLTPVSAASQQIAVVGSKWKYLRRDDREFLFRIAPHADEGLNRATFEPEQRDRLSSALDALLERHPLNVVDPTEINAELRETLRALGYIE